MTSCMCIELNSKTAKTDSVSCVLMISKITLTSLHSRDVWGLIVAGAGCESYLICTWYLDSRDGKRLHVLYLEALFVLYLGAAAVPTLSSARIEMSRAEI